jgi:hypothetical protein
MFTLKKKDPKHNDPLWTPACQERLNFRAYAARQDRIAYRRLVCATLLRDPGLALALALVGAFKRMHAWAQDRIDRQQDAVFTDAYAATAAVIEEERERLRRTGGGHALNRRAWSEQCLR